MHPLYLATAHPWLCDVMGHMTTRHYVAMFDDASYQLLNRATGYDPTDADWTGKGWADVKHIIEYKAEIRAGALIRVCGAITKIGVKSFTASYEMTTGNTASIAATLLGTMAFFDLETRRAIDISPAMRARMEEDMRCSRK